MFLVETSLNLVKSLGNKKIDLCSLWTRTAKEDKMHSGVFVFNALSFCFVFLLIKTAHRNENKIKNKLKLKQPKN